MSPLATEECEPPVSEDPLVPAIRKLERVSWGSER